MKKRTKLISTLTIGALTFSIFSGTPAAFADTINSQENHPSKTSLTGDYLDIYNNLSPDIQNSFTLVSENYTLEEQQLLLQQINPSNIETRGLKSFAIKNALKFAAKQAGKFANAGYVELWLNKIIGATDQSEAALKGYFTNFLTGLGVNRNLAQTIASLAVMVAL